jgi:hypothetical protein
MNGLGGTPKTGAQAKQGQRSAGTFRIQGAEGGHTRFMQPISAAQMTDEKNVGNIFCASLQV